MMGHGDQLGMKPWRSPWPWTERGSMTRQARTSRSAARRARGHVELAQDTGQVPLDGVLAQHQPPGDVGVAQPLGDELEHLELTDRQHRHVPTHCHPRLCGGCALAPERIQNLRRVEGAARGVFGEVLLSAYRATRLLNKYGFIFGGLPMSRTWDRTAPGDDHQADDHGGQLGAGDLPGRARAQPAGQVVAAGSACLAGVLARPWRRRPLTAAASWWT
jgi:hypothetical protein